MLVSPVKVLSNTFDFSVKTVNYTIKASILVLLVIIVFRGYNIPDLTSKGLKEASRRLSKLFLKRHRKKPMDYLSFLLGENEISQKDIEDLAQELLFKSTDRPNFLKPAMALGPILWKLIRSGKNDVEVDLSDWDFDPLKYTLDNDLTPEVLSEIIDGLSDFDFE